MTKNEYRMTRVAVFYDGNYFMHVSNYYTFHHERRARINISGLHQFIERKVAELELVDRRFCHIVDTHFFRGRANAAEAEAKGTLYGDRVFDDILMREGVTTHYLPSIGSLEKGVDVWLALEALELTLYKKFDVIVLVAGDGDFVPLVRKLITAGSRVMLVGWDFQYGNPDGKIYETRVAQALVDEVTYPVCMQKEIDTPAPGYDDAVDSLFYQPQDKSNRGGHQVKSSVPLNDPAFFGSRGIVENLDPRGFGYINSSDSESDKPLFFHANDLHGRSFGELQVGDHVEYEIGRNPKGPCAVAVRVVTEA